MSDIESRRLQGLVFALVAAAFTNIYLTQPVLPVLADEAGAAVSDAQPASASARAIAWHTAERLNIPLPPSHGQAPGRRAERLRPGVYSPRCKSRVSSSA